jgi:hypothetical protein
LVVGALAAVGLLFRLVLFLHSPLYVQLTPGVQVPRNSSSAGGTSTLEKLFVSAITFHFPAAVGESIAVSHIMPREEGDTSTSDTKDGFPNVRVIYFRTTHHSPEKLDE